LSNQRRGNKSFEIATLFWCELVAACTTSLLCGADADVKMQCLAQPAGRWWVKGLSRSNTKEKYTSGTKYLNSRHLRRAIILQENRKTQKQIIKRQPPTSVNLLKKMVIDVE